MALIEDCRQNSLYPCRFLQYEWRKKKKVPGDKVSYSFRPPYSSSSASSADSSSATKSGTAAGPSIGGGKNSAHIKPKSTYTYVTKKPGYEEGVANACKKKKHPHQVVVFDRSRRVNGVLKSGRTPCGGGTPLMTTWTSLSRFSTGSCCLCRRKILKKTPDKHRS